MKLGAAAQSYISLKRSLGAVFRTEARVLTSLQRTIGNVALETIEPQACLSFCRGTGPPTRFWERKHQTLRCFFAFLVSRGHLAVSPLVGPDPKVPRSFVPYIYSRDELRRLLGATAILDTGRCALQSLTFRPLVSLLYASGLRPSEGLRLRCCDVNFADGVLTIWNSKFFKSRLVPIGRDLVRTLRAYYTHRQSLPMPEGLRSAFFSTSAGKAISLGRLENVFARLRTHAKVARPSQSRWQPRLHDLRHSFAVHRLITWYQDGADVQACLPLLATYLGHVNISGTQVYLAMTPQLLAEASKRFEHYADPCTKEQGHG
jgi:integrase/recombinase XerD